MRFTPRACHDCSPFQLAFYIWDKFSYCLGPLSSSLLNFPLPAFLTKALGDDTPGLLGTNRITLSTLRTIVLMSIYLFFSWEHLQAQPAHVRFTRRTCHVIAALILFNWRLAFGTVLPITWVLHHPLFQASLYLLS